MNTITVDPKPKQLWKIREMFLSDDEENRSLADKWLCQLIGVKNAKANLFILTFFKDWEDDSDCIIDPENLWKMKFSTYSIAFGKNYRYTVEMLAIYQGVELIDVSMEYSRFAVGSGQPKFDLCHLLCEAFKRSGYKLYDGLFVKMETE